MKDMREKISRRDVRLMAILGVSAAIATGGLIASSIPKRGIDADRNGSPSTASTIFPAVAGRPEGDVEETRPPAPEGPEAAKGMPSAAKRIIAEARSEVSAKRFDKAIAVLTERRDEVKDRPEAYVVLGQALEGRRDFRTARDFYLAAINRDPYFSEAYWGYATASEGMGDLESAIGGMRSYLHTERDRDMGRLRINQARSAIWEWESQLGRGYWGPTKGIPPGFTADELRRDGRGVAVKMPLPETLRSDGLMQYEIKHADKIKIYPRP
jgi:tetratricopeptide (TPR) repeat protein